MINLEYIMENKRIAKAALERFKSDKTNDSILKNLTEKGEKPEYTAATFLYIRAYDGDDGMRPVPAGVTYWLSPDIEIYRDGIVVDTSMPLEPEKNYTVRVTVRNDGDLNCNSCMVDLYITQPSLGFKTDDMLNIGVSGASVAAHSFTDVDFPFTTTQEMCGHRCMFARVYSLITNDYPADFVYFNSHDDRHIGQQNLNIVKQGETIDFHIVPGKLTGVKEFEINLNKHQKNFTKDKVLLKKYSILTRKAVKIDTFEMQELEIAVTEKRKPANKRTGSTKKNNLVANPDTQKVFKNVKRVSKNTWKHALHEGTNKMSIKVPFLGLEGNEAVPFELKVKDPETGKIIGGITLLVVK